MATARVMQLPLITQDEKILAYQRIGFLPYGISTYVMAIFSYSLAHDGLIYRGLYNHRFLCKKYFLHYCASICLQEGLSFAS